jgi:hypothetical protein
MKFLTNQPVDPQPNDCNELSRIRGSQPGAIIELATLGTVSDADAKAEIDAAVT